MINKNELLESKHFCILPFISSRVWHSLVVPCCINHDEIFGVSTQQSLDEIYSNNNTKLTSFRKQLLNGPTLPDSCSRCSDCERSNVTSLRQSSNQKWSHTFDKLEFNDIGDLKENKFYLWDGVGYSNLCNLKCRMCPSYLSSRTREEEVANGIGTKSISPMQQAFLDKHNLKGDPNEILIESFRDIDLFYKFFDQHVEFIEEIKFEGGEPMMMEQHFRILELLIEKNKTDIRLQYNTNMTRLKFKHYNILDLWKEFNSVTVQVSLDAVSEQNYYIRHPSNWLEILENIDQVRKECPHVALSIYTTIQILNCFAASKLHDWCNNNNLEHRFVFLKHPSCMSLCALPNSYKERVKQHWERYKSNTEVDGFLRMMWANDNSNEITEFLTTIEERDKIRNESLLTTFPEFKELYD
jgi:MoaA/NifB/PqqE/SkfB family radical SAM enzyme